MALTVAVKRAFARLAPTSLAEPWDNVGLILEPSFARPSAPRVLLTIDLTTSVADEALAADSGVGCIVAYHPTIFGGLKSFTLGNPLQKTLLRCAAAGIGVYSPHTSLDSVVGGINDSLASVVSGGSKSGSITAVDGETLPPDALCGRGGGCGRVVELGENIDLDTLVKRVKQGLGLKHVQLARSSAAPPSIQRVGVCAGSGGSVLGPLRTCQAFLTGEMSHHEVLAAVARGTHVILTNHTHTERFFLASVLQPRLQELLDEDAKAQAASEDHEETAGAWRVDVSKADRDPIEIV